MAMSIAIAAAEKHAVKGFAVGMATSALRSMMIGACDEATWSGFRVQGSGFRVQGSGFRVQGSGFRVQGSGFRVQGSG